MDPSYKTGGWGYGGGMAVWKLKGVWGCLARLSINPEGEQSTQHQLCVGVNQVGLLVLFLSFNPKDKQSESVITKALFGAKLLI